MTALGNIYAGARIVAADVQGVAPLTGFKTIDQSVTSSTTLVSDSALFVTVVASASYVFWCWLDYQGGTQGSSDIKVAWQVPSGTTMRYTRDYVSTGGTYSGGGVQIESDTLTAGTNGSTLRSLRMTGSIITSTTPGTLQMQWAQNTSSATSTTVHAQSFLSLWRVA